MSEPKMIRWMPVYASSCFMATGGLCHKEQNHRTYSSDQFQHQISDWAPTGSVMICAISRNHAHRISQTSKTYPKPIQDLSKTSTFSESRIFVQKALEFPSSLVCKSPPLRAAGPKSRARNPGASELVGGLRGRPRSLAPVE